jgi:proteasome alpha subunit
MDERNFSVLGGDAATIAERLTEAYVEDLAHLDAIKIGIKALSGPDRTLGVEDLEIAVLDRAGERRAFRRIERDELGVLL